MEFIQQYNSKLFLPDNEELNSGFLAFILPEAKETPEKPITLSDGMTNASLMGSFVFCTKAPDISSYEKANAFVDLIFDTIINPNTANRGIIWLTLPTDISTQNASMMGINNNGSETNTGLKTNIASGLEFDVASGMQLALDGTSTVLNLGSISVDRRIYFSGASAPKMTIATVGTMDFAGNNMCSILFSSAIERSSLYNDLKWGFQYQFLQETTIISEWLPIASGSLPSATTEIKFNISINPSDPFNAFSKGNTIAEQYASRRTYFDFVGTDTNENPVELVSFYQTVYGQTLNLTPETTTVNKKLPARLVFSPGELTGNTLNDFHLSPEGDFLIKDKTQTNGDSVNMICGLQGTEFFTIKTANSNGEGDSIRFLSLQPAYSDKFPFQPTSPVAAPPVLDAVVMNDTYTTSWATIVKGTTQNVKYVAQPKGAALFGTDSLQGNTSSLYGHTTPGFGFDSAKEVVFPMAPYAGITIGGGATSFTAPQIEAFESQILSGLRRNKVAQGSVTTSLKSIDSKNNTNTISTSTPSGLIAELSGSAENYTWDKVILGQNTIYNNLLQMSFSKPNDNLLQALQTSDLFLVAANKDNLDGFNKYMKIEDWGIEANVGSETSIAYNDYSNIMIIKGRKGILYQPASGTPNTAGFIEASGLVMNSDQWTNADIFSCPQGANKNTDELIILSQWIQNYFKEASEQDPNNPYFKKFNAIALDENWTGTLFLRTDIKDLPNNLTGIMAGVRYPQNFKAHHFAIEISPVSTGSNGPTLGNNPSSMFGLIYYEDKYFVNQTPVIPVTPTNSNPYDFCLLTLKVLFENTTVQKFESYAQLTMNQIYGSRVTGLGANATSALNTVVLNGSLQITNDQAVYAMGSSTDSTFYLDNNILKKVEITNILLTTLDDGVQSGEIRTAFGMSGFLDYNILHETITSNNGEETQFFDVFSFGNLKEKDDNHQGLYYSNLGIDMSFSKEAMKQTETANLQVQSLYNFNTSEITFDIAKSTPRPKSLFLSMALDMQSLVIGTPDEDLSKMGYLQVLSNMRLGSVVGDDWYGLKFQMNMGTPGELAGKVGLTSYFIAAWSPKSVFSDTSYKAQLGIMLPGTGGGAKLISLQSVMTLSIGQIKLVYNKDQEAFLLMLTEIALKFLGMLKVPPSGSTLFYLFGNPKSDGKSSGLGWYAQYTNTPKEDSNAKNNIKRIG